MKFVVSLLVIVILAVIIYVVVYQASSHSRFAELFSWNPFRVSSSSVVILPPPRQTPSGVSPENPLKQGETWSQVTPPAGFTAGQLSPFFEKIYVSSLRGARYSGDSSEIVLKTSWGVNVGIDITGWRVRTNKGEVAIPGAVQDYTPYGTFSEGDITLQPNNYVVIYSNANTSSLGKNFRTNKCSGYLNAVFAFDPPLPNDCPTFSRSEIFDFSGRCQNFIQNLYNCRIPTPNEINSFSGPDDSSCLPFLGKINYSGCYERHRRDLDFFSSEWRVWLGQKIPLDPDHDRVLIFDKQGLLVNEYVY